MSVKNPKSILAFDLDGTLTPRNQFVIHPEGLSKILNYLDMKGHYTVPVTGKPASYAAQIFPNNSIPDRGIVAENAGVYRRAGVEKVDVYGPSLEEMKKLRKLLGIGMEKVNVTKIKIFGKEYQVAIDPGDISILTVFTDPSFVAHRWKFGQSIEADELVEKLRILIMDKKLDGNLVVLAPFPDGGVQVIRKDPKTGIPIDKSAIVSNLHSVYPNLGNVPTAMFGDGHNDIPAMKPNEIIPLTFSNAHDEVIAFVKKKGGFISSYESPEGLGVVDGLLWLTKKDFFKQDSLEIGNTIKKSFTELK